MDVFWGFKRKHLTHAETLALLICLVLVDKVMYGITAILIIITIILLYLFRVFPCCYVITVIFVLFERM